MGENDWTTVGITRGRLRGLKIKALENNRSAGQQLEVILGNLGIKKLSPSQYADRIQRLAQEK